MIRLGIGVFAIVIAIAGVSASALAQQAQSGGPVSLGDLFVASDSAELKPGAAEAFREAAETAQAAGDSLAPGQCPKPRVIVTVEEEDPLWAQTMANARREVLKEVLGPDADRFAFVTDLEGTEEKVEIDTSVADGGLPAITVEPPSGTKVRQGQRLTITVTAAEPATGWQAGVKQIQIEDLDRRTNLEPWTNPAAAPSPCANVGLSQRITRRYRVPDVPVARLKITARDYHNPPETLIVEYPTGEWYGAIEFSVTLANGSYRGRYDIVLDHDGRGNLKGRMEGTRHWDKQTSPSELWADLAGRLAPDGSKMSLNIVSAQQLPGTFGGSHEWGGGLLWVEPLQRQLAELAVAEDGSVQRTIDIGWGEQWQLMLRQARAEN